MTYRKIKKFPLYTEKTFLQKQLSLALKSNQILTLEWVRECNNKKWIISSNGISGNPYPFSVIDKLILLGCEIRIRSFLSQIKVPKVSKVPKVQKGG